MPPYVWGSKGTIGLKCIIFCFSLCSNKLSSTYGWKYLPLGEVCWWWCWSCKEYMVFYINKEHIPILMKNCHNRLQQEGNRGVDSWYCFYKDECGSNPFLSKLILEMMLFMLKKWNFRWSGMILRTPPGESTEAKVEYPVG